MLYVDVSELLGHEYILHGKLGSQQIQAKIDSRSSIRHHENIQMAMDLNKVHFFDPVTEEVIR